MGLYNVYEVKTTSSDGPEIFCEGEPVSLEKVVAALNAYEHLQRKVSHGCINCHCCICDEEGE